MTSTISLAGYPVGRNPKFATLKSRLRQFKICGAQVAPRSLSFIERTADRSGKKTTCLYLNEAGQDFAVGRAEETGSCCMFLLAVMIEIGSHDRYPRISAPRTHLS
jgi:hypothetical protein